MNFVRLVDESRLWYRRSLKTITLLRGYDYNECEQFESISSSSEEEEV